MRVGLWRKLSAEELILLNCGVWEDSWESLGLQGDPTSPFWRRSAGFSLEGMMLKLKLQNFGHLMRRVDLLEKTLMLRGVGGRQEEKGTTEDEMAGWHHWLDGRWVWVNYGSWWWTGRPGVLRFMGSQRVRHDWGTELSCCQVISLFIVFITHVLGRYQKN